MEKIRVFEAFAGYGSQLMALKRLKEDNSGFDFESVGYCDIDKYASMAYEAVHGTDIINYGDITNIKWSEIPDFDLFTYSYPCQDLSLMGKKMGFEEGSGTRSSLLWECMKPIVEKKPKYLLMENVKGLLQKKFSEGFEKWRLWLEEQGYTNYYQIMKASDYGIPQDRERVFMVSILGDEPFIFPEPINLDKSIDDYIEDNVDDSLWCKAVGFNNDLPVYNNVRLDGAVPSIDVHCDRYQWVDTLHKKSFTNKALTITTRVSNCNFYIAKPIGNIYEECDKWLRKPTPRECFRLMDVTDEDIDKIFATGMPKGQLYKMAGNSIVVSCMYHIFKELFRG